MALVQHGTTLHLTQSFRFSKNVASPANALLSAFKSESIPLIGAAVRSASDVIFDESKPYAHICRTNAQVFEFAVEALDAKRAAHFIDGAGKYRMELIKDVYHLSVGNRKDIGDRLVNSFSSLGALKDYAQQIESKELTSVIRIVGKFGDEIPGLIDRIYAAEVESAEEADIILSTVHRAKGLEFRQVWLATDFEPLMNQNGELRYCGDATFVEEINLHYVAITRTMNAIRLSPDVKNALRAIDRGEVPVKTVARNSRELTHVAPPSHISQQATAIPVVVPSSGAGQYLFVCPSVVIDKSGRKCQMMCAQEAVGRAILREGVVSVSRLARTSTFSEKEVLDAAAALVRKGLVFVGFFGSSAERVTRLSPLTDPETGGYASELRASVERVIQIDEGILGRQVLKGGGIGLRQIADSIRGGDKKIAATLVAMQESEVISRYAVSVVSESLARDLVGPGKRNGPIHAL